VSILPSLSGFPVIREDAAMIKLVAGFAVASAFFTLGANAQTAPDLQRTSKTDLAAQTPPAPVIAPLAVGTAFNATLDEVLDTRKAKAGDTVTAETAEDVAYERCTVFPKGAKIEGHVVRVTSGGHGRTGSAIFIQFDKLTMKDGQQVMLNAGIQALAVNGVTPTPAEADAQKNLSGPHTVPVEDNSGAAAASDALVVSTIYEAPRTTVRPPLAGPLATEGEFTSDGLFTLDSKGAFGRPDMKIYTPTSEGSHGTVLLSSRKNLHLESGTHLLLVVQPPPNGESDSTVAAPLDLDPQ
jgi:hypothetical protein